MKKRRELMYSRRFLVEWGLSANAVEIATTTLTADREIDIVSRHGNHGSRY